jgi:hypothetical protein
MKGLNKGIFVELQKGYEENSGKTAMRQEKDWVPFSRILSSPTTPARTALPNIIHSFSQISAENNFFGVS